LQGARGKGNEHRTSNVQHRTSNGGKRKKLKYDLEERQLIIAGGGISVYFSLQMANIASIKTAEKKKK
jgi:hypothetical protein